MTERRKPNPLQATKETARLIRSSTVIPWSCKAVWLECHFFDTDPRNGCYLQPPNIAERTGLEASTVARILQLLTQARFAWKVHRPHGLVDGIRMGMLPELVPPVGVTVDQMQGFRFRLDEYAHGLGIFRRSVRGAAIRKRRAEQLLGIPPAPPLQNSEQLLGIQEELPLPVDRRSGEQLLAELATDPSNCSPPLPLGVQRTTTEYGEQRDGVLHPPSSASSLVDGHRLLAGMRTEASLSRSRDTDPEGHPEHIGDLIATWQRRGGGA